MVKIRPFAAVRPPKQYVEEVAARPYDVLNSAEAKAEAAKIVEEAKQAAAPAKGGMTAEERAKYEAEMDELVEVKLFKDTGKYKDDVFVGCNGEFIAIKRGEKVKIKRKFAEILDNSEHQDYETSVLIEQKSGEFAKTGL